MAPKRRKAGHKAAQQVLTQAASERQRNTDTARLINSCLSEEGNVSGPGLCISSRGW
jgi:hypothetical protein